uniref:Uncharacterized protein n=1 Tax=Picea glauca TaxID=3330 RepID=A0A101LZ43_PICGL|nr:hypothetical protein ABT39_MTgene5025 [Picea glauca]
MSQTNMRKHNMSQPKMQIMPPHDATPTGFPIMITKT